MEYFILFKDQLIKIKKNQNEPESIFIKRIDFILSGLYKNISLSNLLTLSLCYKNILQYSIQYDYSVHKILDEILNE